MVLEGDRRIAASTLSCGNLGLRPIKVQVRPPDVPGRSVGAVRADWGRVMIVEAKVTALEAQGEGYDLKVAAVLSAHKLELAVEELQRRLEARIVHGRRLRLVYMAKEYRFRWRRYIGNGKSSVREGEAGSEGKPTQMWVLMGRRLPEEIVSHLHPMTRRHVLETEQLLDVRRDGRAILHLVEWLLKHALELRSRLIGLTWEGPKETGRVTWTIREDGHLMQRGNWQSPTGPLMAYAERVLSFREAIRVNGQYGYVAGNVRNDLVGRIDTLDERLAESSKQLRDLKCVLRVYPRTDDDSWRFRRLKFYGNTEPVKRTEVETIAMSCSPQQRAAVAEAVSLVEERMRVRRILKVVAIMTEVGWYWPGGSWIIRGYDGRGLSARWMVTSRGHRIRGRIYESDGSFQEQEGGV